MKLIGLVTGSYEGNNFAKLVFTEEFTKSGCYGLNAISSKANYNYVIAHVLPQIDLYLNHEVIANYDRFGRVSEIRLDSLYNDNN